MPQSDISYSFDTGNYILATEDYSIKDHRPHTPGYFLYIKLLDTASLFTKDSYSAYFFLSNLFIALSVPFLFLILRNWIGKAETIFICLVFITNPIIWFYANVPETYPFDVLFSLSLVYVGTERKYSLLILPILALGAGVRISSGVLLIPVALYLLYKSWISKDIKVGGFLLSLILSIIIFLAWFVPMIYQTDGISTWLRLMSEHNPFPDNREVFSLVSILKNSFYVFLYIVIFIGATLISFVTMLFYHKENTMSINKRSILQTALIWLVPGLLFFILYYYVKGYLLLLAGGFYLLLAIPFLTRRAYSIIFIIAIGLQFLYFFCFPYVDPGLNYHYKTLRDNLSSNELISSRILSDLSFTYSQLSALDRRYSDVEKGINEIIHNNYINRTVLIDPSVNVFARSFQPKYPEIRFAEIPPVFDDNYQYFVGLDSKTVDGFKDDLDNMIVISTVESDELYFKDMKELIHIINGVTFSLPKPEKKDEIFKIYSDLCK